MGGAPGEYSGGQSGKNKREFQRRKQVTPQAIYVNCILYN